MKRINTASWIESRKRWQINVQKDGERKTFTSSIAGRNGQREAHRKADAWLDDGIDNTNLRVNALWKSHTERIEITTSASTYRKVCSIGNNYIIPAIGNIKISDVTEGKLQNIIDKAYKEGSFNKDNKQRKKRAENEPLSRKTLSYILSEIKSFIKYCRVNRKVTTLNPESLSIPQGARCKEKNILQPSSLNVLFSVDTTVLFGKQTFDDFIYAYRFQTACGLRPGELLGLIVGDIKGDTVNVRRSLNAKGEITSGKNSNAIRSFTMTPQAKEAYTEQIALLKRNKIALNYNTQLFQINNQSTYYERFKKYLQSNDLPHVSPYELRHTFVSLCKYLPEGQVKPLIGHSKSMDTFGQYGHLINGEAEQTAHDVGALFDKVLSQA